MLDLFHRERDALRLSPVIPLLGVVGLLVFIRLFSFACYALFGVPRSSSGACAGLPLYGLLGLCALLLLTPRLVELLRPIPRVDVRASPDPEPELARQLSPLRRAWLRETRWLLLCVRESSEREVAQHLWEFLASARQLELEDRLELERAGVWPRLSALELELRRDSERLGWRARGRLRATLEQELPAIERALLRSASVDPYR